jgi:glycosyltransferase involved in cell wall biosynthesis
VQVAYDVSAMAGHRTGIGQMVAAFDDSLGRRADVSLTRYVIGRARVSGARRSQLPGRWSLKAWSSGLATPLHRSLRQADVLHGSNFIAPAGHPHTLLTVHDPTPITNAEWCDAAIRPFDLVVRRRVANGAWIHAPTEAVAAELRRELDTDRVRVIHHGPPPPLAPRDERPMAQPYFVAIGTRERRKNFPRLIAAFVQAGRRFADHRLVIVGGPGNAATDIEIAVRRLPPALQASVTVIDDADDVDKATWLGHASALVYPSLDEGFGFPMLEAFSLNVPVVASHVAALREIAGGAALVADPLSVDSIAAAMVRVVDDAARRAELTAAGRARLADFSWDKATDELIALYGEVASS